MKKTVPIAILGSGGHAKVVASTLRAQGYNHLTAYDDTPLRWGQIVMGVPIVGNLMSAESGNQDYGIIAIGHNPTRRTLASKSKLRWLNAVHPSAVVHPSVKVGAGTVIFAGAVVQPDVILGEHCVVNTGATIDHDCVLEDFSHIGPGAHLAGNVHVGEGAFMGVGSVAIPGVKIGAWTTVGAGGVVVSDLPARVLAIGVPARVKREL